MIINISSDQLDILKEITSIGVGRAAAAISDMMSVRVGLTLPNLRQAGSSEVSADLASLSSTLVAVHMSFSGPNNGMAMVCFSPQDAKTLVGSLTGEAVSAGGLDDLAKSTLCEVGNIVINGIMGSLATSLSCIYDYHIPEFKEGTVDIIAKGLNIYDNSNKYFITTAGFDVSKIEIVGRIILCYDAISTNNLLAKIDNLI